MWLSCPTHSTNGVQENQWEGVNLNCCLKCMLQKCKKNKTGPSTDPCKIPLLKLCGETVTIFYVASSYLSACFPFYSHSFHQFSPLPALLSLYFLSDIIKKLSSVFFLSCHPLPFLSYSHFFPNIFMASSSHQAAFCLCQPFMSSTTRATWPQDKWQRHLSSRKEVSRVKCPVVLKNVVNKEDC